MPIDDESSTLPEMIVAMDSIILIAPMITFYKKTAKGTRLTWGHAGRMCYRLVPTVSCSMNVFDEKFAKHV